jgi:tRNA dimethylallyltransferase
MAPGGATPLAAIVGPTASGKTELALPLAERMGAEIVVADSRQVYRGMDLGTAKPTPTERGRVPHHLLDLVTPDRPFSVADWVRAARATIGAIAARRRLPLVVGGTGLYLTALVDGYDFDARSGPAPELRARLTAELAADGLPALARRLAERAPAVAAAIDLSNPRRVLRALERIEQDGPSSPPPALSPWPAPVAMLGVSRPRDVLHRRIDERARALFAGGLLDEVRRLHDAGYGPELEPMSGHGYREAHRVLVGEWSIEEAIAVTARRTRQYAKRQLTWFRQDRRIVWLEAGDGPGDDPRLVARAEGELRRLLAVGS